MLKRVLVACLVQAAVASTAHAAGPFGTIHVGAWVGGAFSDDNTGGFSHCAATSSYASGISLVVGINAANSWLISFASPAFRFTKGENLPIDVTFDGQFQARLFASAISPIMVTAILPPNVARDFCKSSLMVAVARDTPLQFNLTSTGPLLTALANCASKVKADGFEREEWTSRIFDAAGRYHNDDRASVRLRPRGEARLDKLTLGLGFNFAYGSDRNHEPSATIIRDNYRSRDARVLRTLPPVDHSGAMSGLPADLPADLIERAVYRRGRLAVFDRIVARSTQASSKQS